MVAASHVEEQWEHVEEVRHPDVTKVHLMEREHDASNVVTLVGAKSMFHTEAGRAEAGNEFLAGGLSAGDDARVDELSELLHHELEVLD